MCSICFIRQMKFWAPLSFGTLLARIWKLFESISSVSKFFETFLSHFPSSSCESLSVLLFSGQINFDTIIAEFGLEELNQQCVKEFRHSRWWSRERDASPITARQYFSFFLSFYLFPSLIALVLRASIHWPMSEIIRLEIVISPFISNCTEWMQMILNGGGRRKYKV